VSANGRGAASAMQSFEALLRATLQQLSARHQQDVLAR
jgi:hypothetical protein